MAMAEIYSFDVLIDDHEVSIAFEIEFAAITDHGKHMHRIFCRTCQDVHGGRKHHWQTDPFQWNDQEQFERTLVSVKKHAEDHAKLGTVALQLIKALANAAAV